MNEFSRKLSVSNDVGTIVCVVFVTLDTVEVTPPSKLPPVNPPSKLEITSKLPSPVTPPVKLPTISVTIPIGLSVPPVIPPVKPPSRSVTTPSGLSPPTLPVKPPRRSVTTP